MSYTDNGNGSVTDTVTGLTWEKKTDDGSAHDKDNTGTWTPLGAFDATHGYHGTCSDFIDTLNGAAFAGHTDWRLPSIFELWTLVDPTLTPRIATVFGGVGGLSGTTIVEGAPYARFGTCRGQVVATPYPYWTATAAYIVGLSDVQQVYAMDFAVRSCVYLTLPSNALHARAVRGAALTPPELGPIDATGMTRAALLAALNTGQTVPGVGV